MRFPPLAFPGVSSAEVTFPGTPSAASILSAAGAFSPHFSPMRYIYDVSQRSKTDGPNGYFAQLVHAPGVLRPSIKAPFLIQADSKHAQHYMKSRKPNNVQKYHIRLASHVTMWKTWPLSDPPRRGISTLLNVIAIHFPII